MPHPPLWHLSFGKLPFSLQKRHNTFWLFCKGGLVYNLWITAGIPSCAQINSPPPLGATKNRPNTRASTFLKKAIFFIKRRKTNDWTSEQPQRSENWSQSPSPLLGYLVPSFSWQKSNPTHLFRARAFFLYISFFSVRHRTWMSCPFPCLYSLYCLTHRCILFPPLDSVLSPRNLSA